MPSIPSVHASAPIIHLQWKDPAGLDGTARMTHLMVRMQDGHRQLLIGSGTQAVSDGARVPNAYWSSTDVTPGSPLDLRLDGLEQTVSGAVSRGVELAAKPLPMQTDMMRWCLTVRNDSLVGARPDSFTIGGAALGAHQLTGTDAANGPLSDVIAAAASVRDDVLAGSAPNGYDAPV